MNERDKCGVMRRCKEERAPRRQRRQHGERTSHLDGSLEALDLVSGHVEVMLKIRFCNVPGIQQIVHSLRAEALKCAQKLAEGRVGEECLRNRSTGRERERERENMLLAEKEKVVRMNE